MAKGTLKFKDSVAEYERLTGEIAARRFAGIYLLMGEEGYFIDAVAEQLAASILDEAARAFNQITVYGRDSDAGQVVNLCRQMPMMGRYQVVIVKEAQHLRNLDKLSLYTQKPSPTTILVICHKEKNVDKRSALYKGCAANGAVLESVRPRDYEIAAWLQQFIRRRGLEIDPKALAMLTDHLGTDISKIANELQKTHRLAARRHAAHHRPRHRGQYRHLEGFQQLRALQGGRHARHGAGPDDRRPLRPQPEGQSAAGDRHGPVQPVPGPVRRELPALARAAPEPALSAGPGADAHPAQEQHLHPRGDQAERRTVGQPQGLSGAGAAARIRRQEQGNGFGRRLGRRAAAPSCC